MKGPQIGEHVATLNLFREADGYHLTVMSAQPRLVVQARVEGWKTVMQLLAEIMKDAGPRFVKTWGKKDGG